MSEGSQSISSYRDLRVWTEGMELAAAIYRLTSRLPKDELYGLTSQLRRAATSVPANVAEGYGRDNRGSYIQHLRIAQGSLKELETHLLLTEKVGLLARVDIEAALTASDGLGRMLRSLIRSLESKSSI